MDVLTILGYLLGSRPAIERVAADVRAPWVGLALVASAALARSYASRDLVRQPWHLLLPVAAALALSFLLAGLLYARLASLREAPPFPAAFRSVAGLVLLTAPLAWLYAIPFHRFLPWPRALRARLITLGVVAAWRVAVVVRALGVLLDDRPLTALCFVLLVCDAVALLALLVTAEVRAHAPRTTPAVLGGMGGIEARQAPTAERDLMNGVSCGVAVAGVLTLPVWIGGAAGMAVSGDPWRALLSAPADTPPSPGVWVLALVPLAGFLALLPWTQRRPRLRGRVEGLLKRGKVGEAVTLMSAHPREDFPPGWSPAPTGNFREPPTLLDVLEAVIDLPAESWVRQAYLERLRFFLSDPLWFWHYDRDLEQVAGLLARLEDGPALARQVLDSAEKFGDLPDRYYGVYPEPEPTGRRDEVVAAIRRLAGG
jgi:hypothetical protein